MSRARKMLHARKMLPAVSYSKSSANLYSDSQRQDQNTQNHKGITTEAHIFEGGRVGVTCQY